MLFISAASSFPTRGHAPHVNEKNMVATHLQPKNLLGSCRQRRLIGALQEETKASVTSLWGDSVGGCLLWLVWMPPPYHFHSPTPISPRLSQWRSGNWRTQGAPERNYDKEIYCSFQRRLLCSRLLMNSPSLIAKPPRNPHNNNRLVSHLLRCQGCVEASIPFFVLKVHVSSLPIADSKTMSTFVHFINKRLGTRMWPGDSELDKNKSSLCRFISVLAKTSTPSWEIGRKLNSWSCVSTHTWRVLFCI